MRDELKQSVCDAGRAMAAANLAFRAWGSVSAVDRESNLAAITPADTPTGREGLALLGEPELLWEAMTARERNVLYHLLLDGVFVRGERVAAIVPRPPFRALLEEAAARLAAETGVEPPPLALDEEEVTGG